MRMLYKKGNEVYEFEQDGSQNHLITSDYILMNEDEVDRHLYPEKYLSEAEKYQNYLQTLKPLTRRQFRMAFVLNGYDLDSIKNKILEIEDMTIRQLTLIEWEDAITFERTNASLVMMAQLLGLSEDQVNAMWEQALTL